MLGSLSSAGSSPAELCGCPVDSALSAEHGSFLAIGPGGRGVVLKKLDHECMWNGALHPSVKERLNRVRELAHPGVANLFGVERSDGEAYLMWEYVPGTCLDEHAIAKCSPREFISLARELILTVDLLHTQGVVHGALVPSNVIVTPAGALRLTHISPLLYIDADVDRQSVITLLEHIVEARHESGSPVGQALVEAHEQNLSLKQIGARIALLSGSSGTQADEAEPRESSAAKRWGFFGALFVLLLGFATAWIFWHAIQTGHLASASAITLPIDSHR